jgi:hypothetical protein
MSNTSAKTDQPALARETARDATAGVSPRRTKLQTIIALLQRPHGATIDELVSATAWQKHSIRGAISGTLKNKHQLEISSTLAEGRGRVYRIEAPESLVINTIDAGSGVRTGGQS